MMRTAGSVSSFQQQQRPPQGHVLHSSSSSAPIHKMEPPLSTTRVSTRRGMAGGSRNQRAGRRHNDSLVVFRPTGFGDGHPDETCSDAWIEVLPKLQTLRFAFSITAGHTATTTFGSLDSFDFEPAEKTESLVCSTFETARFFGDLKVCNADQHRRRGQQRAATFFMDERERESTMRALLANGVVPPAFLPDGETLQHPCGLPGRAATAYLKAWDAGDWQASLCSFAGTASNAVKTFLKAVERAVETHDDALLKGGAVQYASTPRCGKGITPATQLFLDMGHSTIFGLGDAWVRALGAHRVSFVRIRRGRHSNAMSFIAESKIPCNGNGLLVLCPFDHGSVLMESDPDWPAKWSKLNKYQRCLWLIDEVEARWSALETQHSLDGVEMLEVEWKTGDDLSDGLEKTAAFFAKQVAAASGRGGGAAAAAAGEGGGGGGGGGGETLKIRANHDGKVKVRHHTGLSNGRNSKTSKKYKGLQAEYLEIMQYTDAQLALIQKQLDYNDLN